MRGRSFWPSARTCRPRATTTRWTSSSLAFGKSAGPAAVLCRYQSGRRRLDRERPASWPRRINPHRLIRDRAPMLDLALQHARTRAKDRSTSRWPGSATDLAAVSTRPRQCATTPTTCNTSCGQRLFPCARLATVARRTAERRALASKHRIDPLAGLAGDRVYLFHGESDSVVATPVATAAE